MFLSRYTWKKRSRIRASFACVERRPKDLSSQETRVHEGIVCEFLECFFSIERVAMGFSNHGQVVLFLFTDVSCLETFGVSEQGKLRNSLLTIGTQRT